MKPDRERIPSGEMLRANTAVAFVLVAVLVLALVAVLAGLRAARSLSRAEAAESAGRERLWNAYLATARAVRISGEAGRRNTALVIISNAATFRATSALRTEAVACLALSDLTLEGPVLPTPAEVVNRSMDTDLKRYAYGDSHGNIFIGNLENDLTLFELHAPDLGAGTKMAVRTIVFSPDRKLLAVRYAGGAVAVWNLATKQVLMSADVESTKNPLSNLSFSPDSKEIIFADPEAQGQITVYEAATGHKISTGVPVGYNFFRLRPDGQQAAMATNEEVLLMDYPSGTHLQRLQHTAFVSMLAWSPGGNLLATACGDGDVYVWDLVQGTHRILRGHSERCVNLGFSQDGRQFFSTSRDGTTRLWDVLQGQTIAVGDGFGESLSPDGTRLGFWRTPSGFGVWSVSHSVDYRLLACPKSSGPLFTLDLSPSGQWCVATQNKGFRVWNLNADDQECYVELPDFYCARIAADEKSLFICSKTGLQMWPLTNHPGGRLELNPVDARIIPLPDSLGARAITLSLNGRAAAIELMDRRLVVLDLTGKHAPVSLQGRWRNVNFKGPASYSGAGRFAISPDGRWVATGFDFGGNDVPRVWDAQSGELAATLKTDTSVVAFSPDGRWLGLAGVSQYSVWSVGDWQLHGRFERDEPSITHGAMAFGGDSNLLAVASSRKNIRLRSLGSEENFFDLIGPAPQSVNSVRMAMDGSVLVTATASDMVQVWRLGHLREELKALNLDWEASARPDRINIETQPIAGVTGPRATLALSLVGVLLAGVFAVITLRQHRASVARFINAEAKTAQHNRELEIAKAELMHSQKMQALGTIAAGVAHDFNNLLSVIRMSNKLVGRTTQDAEIQEHVADIEQAAVQGKNVVRSMLGYARDESFPAEPANVNEVIERTVSLLNKEFLSCIRLILELSPESQPVAIKQGRLEQILLNLIVNASEAMQGHGSLKITARLQLGNVGGAALLHPSPSPHYVELTVGDSGPGIPPEIIGRIFEPFFSTKRVASAPGTGLGLSLVYSIAQQDGLGLSVASVLGKGAIFSVLIPVATG